MSLSNFNPNSIAQKGNTIFGLPFNYNNSKLIIQPVPWEVTVSYGSGTSQAIAQIFDAGMQVDLLDLEYEQAWQKGIFFNDIDLTIFDASKKMSILARKHIKSLESGVELTKNKIMQSNLELINKACVKMNNWVYEQTKKILANDKKIILLGGDHSTPYGYLKALTEKYSDFGILQIDAHCDLRNSYEYFIYSHASIMYNVLETMPQIKKLVQVGIRDLCDEEINYIKKNKKIDTFFDKDIQYQKIEKKSWANICDNIIKKLPQNVYISFDIDGLKPELCPDTGTPVMGGLEISEIYYLFNKIHQSKKKIIGIDLVEVGYSKTSDWNANVGSRILYKLASLFLNN